MGTVKAVHAYRADLDRLSESLADLAPDRAQPDIHEKITTNAINASARVQGDKKNKIKKRPATYLQEGDWADTREFHTQAGFGRACSCLPKPQGKR